MVPEHAFGLYEKTFDLSSSTGLFKAFQFLPLYRSWELKIVKCARAVWKGQKTHFWPISISSQGTSLRCYMMFFMGKLRCLNMFLGFMKNFLTLVHPQASSKLSNICLYTGPESSKSWNVPERFEKVKKPIFDQSQFRPSGLPGGVIWCFMGKLRSLNMFLGFMKNF